MTGVSSLCYLGLLFIVVSTNALSIISLKSFALVLIAVEILLNISGYFAAFLTKLAFKKNEAFYPMLFIAGSKEFGIATVAAGSMGLNPTVMIPSAFFAMVQMVSMPVAVKIIKCFEIVKEISASEATD
jgi:BASS family bile acid:Na+ symporter